MTHRRVLHVNELFQTMHNLKSNQSNTQHLTRIFFIFLSRFYCLCFAANRAFIKNIACAMAKQKKPKQQTNLTLNKYPN